MLYIRGGLFVHTGMYVLFVHAGMHVLACLCITRLMLVTRLHMSTTPFRLVLSKLVMRDELRRRVLKPRPSRFSSSSSEVVSIED